MALASTNTNPPIVHSNAGNAIIINPCQRLNPLLDCIRNVGKEFGDIVPDFQVGRTTGVLYLSLKYHRLHPEYIYQRIEKLGNMFTLRVLLLICDISEHQDSIKEITKTCIINNITVMVAWTLEEAGFYLSTFKSFEHKPPDLIKERVDKDFSAMYRTSLTSISRVNKTDVETLKTNFGSLAEIATASSDKMQLLPGLGRVKVRRIKDAFEKPFYPRPVGTDKRGPSMEVQSLNKQPQAAHTPQIQPKSREPSPIWDIELDLNPSDVETEPTVLEDQVLPGTLS